MSAVVLAADPGEAIQELAALAVDVARRSGQAVALRHNDRQVEVSPEDTTEQVVERWRLCGQGTGATDEQIEALLKEAVCAAGAWSGSPSGGLEQYRIDGPPFAVEAVWTLSRLAPTLLARAQRAERELADIRESLQRLYQVVSCERCRAGVCAGHSAVEAAELNGRRVVALEDEVAELRAGKPRWATTPGIRRQ